MRELMHRPMATAVALLLCSPGPAISQACGDRQTQAEMNQCAAADYATVDGELNKVYNDYRSRLTEVQKRQLGDAQLAWIRFRDLSCEFESSGVKGGSAHPFVLQSCLAAMTRARIQQLSTLAGCEEGDLTCPAPK
jgi:uncharacterized protein YecT (DUF1311 family)